VPVWYHGTTKENAENILKEGFRAGTYFGQHMEDALHFGGDIVFEVWFSKPPSEDWQWVCPEAVPISKILTVIALQPSLIYWSTEAHQMKNKDLFLEDGLQICEKCKGKGQLEECPPLERWKDMDTVTVCPVCKGHGHSPAN
jgi:hypothetical protein